MKYQKQQSAIPIRVQKMYRLRQQGKTQRAIGNLFHISSERVRQLLVKFYGSSRRPFIGVERLRQRLRANNIKCRYSKTNFPSGLIYIDGYNKEQLLKKFGQKCRHCGTTMPTGKRVLCEKCSSQSEHYSYPFLTKTSKKKWLKRSKRWITNNHEHRKAYQRNRYKNDPTGTIAKQRVEHFLNTKYIVIKEDSEFPTGMIFQAVTGIGRSHLQLADGRIISKSRIKTYQ